jgi:hypothetical protein
MRIRTLIVTILVGVGAGVGFVAVSGGSHSAQAQQQPQASGPRTGYFTLNLRGAQQSLNDTVRSTLLEYDPPKAWQLLIIGAKGKGQFTCELRSTDRAFLVTLQRAITEGKDISVSCANGTPSTRGGVSIDLDDPKGGSFVLGAGRP